MVMLRYGQGITEINGKQGGEVYRRDRCGNHKQAYYHEHHEPTAAQRKRRRWFRKLMILFLKKWGTPDVVSAWMEYSVKHPKTNKKGEIYFLNPLMMFISYNLKRVINDLDPVQYPPDDF